jgi:hypothetical protein
MKFRYTTESVYRVRIAKPATLRARPPTGEIDGREFLSRNPAECDLRDPQEEHLACGDAQSLE